MSPSSDSTDNVRDGSRRLRAIDATVSLAICCLVLATGATRIVPGVVGAFHDDGVYAATAKSLAEGNGYRLINLPGAPAQTKFPIIYPLVLAPAWKLAPSLVAKLTAMQLVSLVSAALSLALAYLYVTRFGYLDRFAAAAAALLCATAPNFLYYATQILSELPFALSLVVALWACDAHLASGRTDTRSQLTVGVLAGLPFLIRTVGIVVAPAVLLVLVLRGRRPWWTLLGAAFAITPWALRMASGFGNEAANPTLGYNTNYFGFLSWTTMLLRPSVIVSNAQLAAAAFSHITLEGLMSEMYSRVDWAHGLAIAIGTLPWVWLANACRTRAALPIVLAVYGLAVVVWPWPPDRFLIPILFFLAGGWLALAIRILTFALRKEVAAGLIVVAAASSAAAVNGRLLSTYGEANRESEYPYFVLGGDRVDWASYERSFDWIRRNTRPDDVIATGFDSMTYLYTGRPALRPFIPRLSTLHYGDDAPLLGTAAELTATLDGSGATYLFLSPMPAFPESDAFYELVGEYMRSHPGALVTAYADADARFRIFRISGALQPHAGD